MKKKKTLEESKADFQKKMEEVKNKTYSDWDSIIIQLNLGETAGGNIRMMRQDVESMSFSHGTTIGQVMEMMIKALEEQAVEKTKEDAIS